MDIEKSIDKGRIIYNEKIWDKFWTLIIPTLITGLLLISLYFAIESNYDKPEKNNYRSIIIGYILLFGVIILLIIIYFNIDNLSVFRGKSRTFNKKLVLLFVKEQGYEIISQENDIIRIDIKTNSKNSFNKVKLTVFFKEASLYYNCTTFENINTGRFSIVNFKSPFYWIANKRNEKRFLKFIQENS